MRKPYSNTRRKNVTSEKYVWVAVTKGAVSLNRNNFFYLHYITLPMVKGKRNRNQHRVHCITRLKQPALYLYLAGIVLTYGWFTNIYCGQTKLQKGNVLQACVKNSIHRG